MIQTKPNRCKHCKVRLPADMARHVLHPECIDPWVAIQREKQEKARVKAAKVRQVQDKRETRAKLQKLKTRGEWLAEAKVAIQQFRRLEELSKGRGCMSCKRSQEEVAGTDGWRPGGLWDGGHFLSKGARPELALEPLNIWLQCKSCNAGSGKYARKGYTVNASFEANLIEQEGVELVEWLKGPLEAKHYTTDQLIEIKATYAAKVRELKKEQV